MSSSDHETKPDRQRLVWKTRLFALIVILSNVLGNFSLDWGMKHQAAPLDSSPLSYIRAIFTPWVGVGIVLLIVWMLSRMALLSWADLSFVLPATSMGYVLTAVIGRVFLNEQVDPKRWAGTAFIVAGTMLVASSPPRTGHGEKE